MNYIKLSAGIVRQKGDEVRYSDLGPATYECHGVLDTYYGSGRSPTKCLHWHEPRKINPGTWVGVQLIGHSILQSDLMIAEFRREVAID